jgi:hypothetical protein
MVSIDRLVLAGAPSAARTSVSHSKPQQPMDSLQGELGWPFDSVPVGMHTSPPLIGMYRSIPSCNRLDSKSQLGFIPHGLTIAAYGLWRVFSDERL